MAATPLQQVKERFGEKKKLVAAVKKLGTKDLWLDRVNDAKGLDHVSNAKLLRLHDTLERAKKEFGSRAKLVDAILALESRSKDAGYKARLTAYPVGRLLDLHAAATRRSKRPKRVAKKTKKVARTKKAKAKLRAS